VGLVRCLEYDGWAKDPFVETTGNGRRWVVETAYSTFKWLFGAHSMARCMVNIAREFARKASLYNMLVNI
jgi:hypothetical protein